MREDVVAAAICLGFFAVIFLVAGIIPLVIYFGLKRGENAVAEVTEHVSEAMRTDRRQIRHDVLLKLKYSVSGVEYENKYGVIKTKEYIDSHPVGTAIKIIVDPKNPKRFILPEDMKKPLIPGIIFTVGGVASLAGVIVILLGAGV